VTVRFLEVAKIELDQAFQWYESQAPGLGNAFLIEIMAAAERISLYPEAWQSLDRDVRRCRLNRFPYGLLYSVENGDVLILAVAHLHREPSYWRERLKR
jgi:toxin ParE2